MISEDTLAAALRVDQYSARRAMLAVHTETPDDLRTSTELSDHAEATPALADNPRNDTSM